MYEIKPYFCFALAIWVMQMDVVLDSSFAGIAKISAMFLIMLGAAIIYMRGANRGYFGS